MQDAARDLKDIGAEMIPLQNLTSSSYKKRLPGEGVVFSTFSGLTSSTKSTDNLFSNRLAQLQDWLGVGGFDGALVFDECHQAKNLVPVKGGKPTKVRLPFFFAICLSLSAFPWPLFSPMPFSCAIVRGFVCNI